MNQLFEVNRELRGIQDEEIQSREYAIQKIMVSYNYDRENAEKVLAMTEVRAFEKVWGCSFGALAAYKFNPIYSETAHRYPFFRKAWMRYPMQLAVFAAGYGVSTQVPSRLQKWIGKRGVTDETAMSSTDLVGRFRMFESNQPASAEGNLMQYLHEYSDRPFVKDELVERLAEMQAKGHKMRIRRMGKDLDDFFWQFGKIHGLENVALLSDEELQEVAGNPIKLQKLINTIEKDQQKPTSVEENNLRIQRAMEDYKYSVTNQGDKSFIGSDRKKLLALPIQQSKHIQRPEPKRGQSHFSLFTNLTGREFTANWGTVIDKENKITEFEFEKFLNPSLLGRVKTQEDFFLNFVRKTNFATRTKFESLEDNKELFTQSMSVLSDLTPEEQRALVHKLANRRGQADAGEEDLEDLYDYMMERCPLIERRLAKLSEEERYALKNRYRHQWQTMNYADKKRMPIHESKVVDVLRNSHLYRGKIVEQIPTFEKELNETQMNNGVLSYLNEAAYGELRELVNEVGIRDETIPFTSLAQLNKMKEQNLFESDHQMRYLQNALYTPIDMTDYEDQIVSWRELPGALPIGHTEKLDEWKEEDWPQVNALIEKTYGENPPLVSTGPTWRGIMENERVVPEPEEEEEDEEGDGDDYGDYGEEGEEGDYGDEYGEEEEGPPSRPAREWPSKDIIKMPTPDTRAFRSEEKLRKRFNEVEIDNFMKLLAIKPKVQWQDDSFFHSKLGIRDYEDGH